MTCFSATTPSILSITLLELILSQASLSLSHVSMYADRFLGSAGPSVCRQPRCQFIYFFLYLYGYEFATYVMHDVTSHKKYRVAQSSFVIFSAIR